MAGWWRSKLDRRLRVRIDAKRDSEPLLSIKVCWRCRRRAGFATGITLDWLPSSRVWSVAAARQTHIICDLRNQKRLAAKSAMSSLCRCVVAIIARFIAVAMKQHGGTRPALIRPFPLVPCGWKAIRCPQRAVTTKAESNGVRLTKRSQLLKSVPHDLHQTDRGQPNYSCRAIPRARAYR